MPLYEYECKPHQHRFEVRHGYNEEPVQACPECGGEVRRVIQPVGVVFKGTGFYVNDSRKSSAKAKPADGKAAEAKPADGKPADGKAPEKPAAAPTESKTSDSKTAPANTRSDSK